MAQCFITMPATTITARMVWVRPFLALLLTTTPLIAKAIPTNMGVFNLSSSTVSNANNISGTYTTANKATGTFNITRNEMNGYQNNAIFTAGNNGIMIHNQVKQGTTSDDEDKFTYTITIEPTDKNAIHTIKIGQTSYSAEGNSEIARQTLRYTNFTDNEQIVLPATATIVENPSVNYFFGAMGDYFMGRKLNNNRFSSNNATASPQLRVDDSSNNDLYYYGITTLNGSGDSNSFTPTTTNERVTFAAGRKRGTLPSPATFENILKSTSTSPNNRTTYAPLSVNTSISSGGSYVSYGIDNSDSNYVIAIKNAKTVTLTYEGIMKGNSGVEADVVGETYNEWISFGVESTPVYVFSGIVFNDNGGITDAQADANNANINTGTYNNLNYFNGKFENTIETGITGSTISLADKCENPSTIYATKNVTSTKVNEIGKYQFEIIPSLLNNKSSVCMIETNTNSAYPILTTSNVKLINLTNNTYAYDNHNFGRVIAKNVALVLEKEQAANNCKLSNLTDPSIAYSKSALTSSQTGAGADIKPGQCIAYKITATNRSNVSIDNFIMQDKLQKKDPNDPTGPKVTSVLANPARSSGDFNDSLVTGQNGTIRTRPFVLDKKSKRSFYFNTQYGSTQSH